LQSLRCYLKVHYALTKVGFSKLQFKVWRIQRYAEQRVFVDAPVNPANGRHVVDVSEGLGERERVVGLDDEGQRLVGRRRAKSSK